MEEDRHRYKKGSWIWWKLPKSRPTWIPKARLEQAGEIVDTDITSGHAVIAIINETRIAETYVVPLDQIRPRGGKE